MDTLTPDDYRSSSYATHYQALLRVFLRFRPRTILETGSGRYSTRLLLAFDIDRLVSVENDRDWYLETGDPRHELIWATGRVVDALPDLSDFDLVFVDDDPIEERQKTIRKVLAEAPGLVVIHDTNDPSIHDLIARRPNYTDPTPPTTTVLHPRRNKEFRRWLATS